ncbi:hypothetical protein T492DRAFT_836487 [Pavlovales sp. CCMP2436]|nr:hypothetical protein T492DRAFT_836487 [Pavlovales sp. CCMP2436]
MRRFRAGSGKGGDEADSSGSEADSAVRQGRALTESAITVDMDKVHRRRVRDYRQHRDKVTRHRDWQQRHLPEEEGVGGSQRARTLGGGDPGLGRCSRGWRARRACLEERRVHGASVDGRDHPASPVEVSVGRHCRLRMLILDEPEMRHDHERGDSVREHGVHRPARGDQRREHPQLFGVMHIEEVPHVRVGHHQVDGD